MNFYCLRKLITFVCCRYVNKCVCVCVCRQLKSFMPQPGVNATCSVIVIVMFSSLPLLPLLSFVCGKKQSFPSLHHPLDLSLQHFTISSLLDDHFIHRSSWKDKYCLVECEAPASLRQTKDEGKDRKTTIVLQVSSSCHAFVHIWQPKYLLCGLSGL